MMLLHMRCHSLDLPGAGFVGSGPIVLLLELLDRVGPHPTQSQRLLLYSAVVPFFTFLGKCQQASPLSPLTQPTHDSYILSVSLSIPIIR